MKFFKHFVDADTGSLNDLMNRLGVEAYGRYWLFTALCVSTLEKPKGGTYKEEHMKFTFNSRQLREKLRIKSGNLGIFLGICQELTLFQWELTEDKYNFYFPNILKSMDRDSKRARTERGSGAPKKKNKIKNKEEDKEIKEQLEKIYSELYPLKKGKQKGIDKLTKDLKPEEIPLFKKAVLIYKADCEAKGTAPEFIKHFSTFASTWRECLDPDYGKSNITPLRSGLKPLPVESF